MDAEGNDSTILILHGETEIRFSPTGTQEEKLLRKMAKLAAMTALAAAAVTAPMTVPAAHAATTQTGHAVTTRSVHGNLMPAAGNGCSTYASPNGWNIGVCSYTGTFEAWGDGYVNGHGPMPQGCTIELYTTDSGGTTLYSNYPCSMYGHIGPNTYTGFTLGDHIQTTVDVRTDYYGYIFSHTYTN